MTTQRHPTELDAEQLRWRCDVLCLSFTDTRELDPAGRVGGQTIAWEALKFGLECHARGQNVYVRGVSGTGRMSMVRQLLKIAEPLGELYDRGYVHNFSRPDRPRLISVPAGQGRKLRRLLAGLVYGIAEELPKALNSEQLLARRGAIQRRIQARVREITAPLEADLKQADMALVSLPSGQTAQTVIMPVYNGQPVPPEQLQQLAAAGQVSQQAFEQFQHDYPTFMTRLGALSRDVNGAYRDGARELDAINEDAARQLLDGLCEDIVAAFPQPALATFLTEVADDVVETRLRPAETLPDPEVRYGINLIVEHEPGARAPVVEERNPSLINLLGTVEPRWNVRGPLPADYRGIHAGALARADGGYLVLDVHDVLAEPGAWRALTRSLRAEQLEIVPAEFGMLRPHVVIKPEPIAIRVRVVLIGDAQLYYQLDRLDPDFAELFKVLADFDTELPRDVEGVRRYAAVLAQIAREEQLKPLTPDAVAALAEHGARIASRAGKLTARFGRIADLAREASFLAAQQSAALIDRDHVEQAIRRTKRRASLPLRRFQELVNSGTIRVQTDGSEVGQINGLAVISAGPIRFGFPARITATIGPGRAGLINIEGSAALSGAIHTKGFHILGGLLRHLLRTDHPLAFSASIAFEQSYGGIDGDSASGAEICCLLSALTDIPVRQSLAMTGAIDQFGHIQAIGGVNEKIEGFFDACVHAGLRGDQGVLIPAANAGDLMLRAEVAAACARGDFHVYAVDDVYQALELLTGRPAGNRADARYQDGSVLAAAVAQAEAFWRKTLSSPQQLTRSVGGGEDDGEDGDGDDTVTT